MRAGGVAVEVDLHAAVEVDVIAHGPHGAHMRAELEAGAEGFGFPETGRKAEALEPSHETDRQRLAIGKGIAV